MVFLLEQVWRRSGREMDFFWEMLSLQETLFLLILLGVLVKK